MALECPSHRSSLHEVGKKELSSFNKGYAYPRYKVAKTPDEEPVVPESNLFDNFGVDKHVAKSDNVRLPNIAECATHLELLEAFYVLRQRIVRSEEIDRTLGIEHIHTTKTGKNGDQKTFKDQTLWKRRQAKWPRFIEIAVIRFLAWKDMCEHDTSKYRIPPIDVLMVWHALLLNPRLFRTHCRDSCLHTMYLPWARIHQALNSNHWTFVLPEEATKAFEKGTGLAADLFEQLSNWKTQHDNAAAELISSVASLTPESRYSTPQWVSGLSANDQVRKHFEALQNSNVDTKLAMELRNAVLRQASFVDKMNAHMWIRSPGVSGTLTRAVDRYSKFLRLMKLYPKTMFVPTLDIDLAWHTHQCNPTMYYKGTKLWAGRFINHDDTIVKDTLDDGFGTTKTLFRVHFGKEYRVCGCWDCEALLSALEHPAKTEDGSVDMENIVRNVAAEVAYFRAIETARRKKQPLPVRD